MGVGPGWKAVFAVVLVGCVGPEAPVVGSDDGGKVEDEKEEEEEDDGGNEVENVNV